MDYRSLFWDVARSLEQHVKASAPDVGGGAGARPGDLYNQRANWSDLLVPAGWTLVETLGTGASYWKRPGDSDHRWSASLGYLRTGDGVALFYPFSSAVAPFEMGKTYTPFAAYATLHHDGDFRAAATELARQGYTSRATATRGGGDPEATAPPASPPASPLAAVPRQETDEVIFPDEVPWPDPLSPLAYHGLAGRIVRAIEPQTEADPVAILIQILVLFGNAIGRSAHWAVEGDKHYANLFACLVGESSKGRKGTSKGRALQAFAAVDDPSWRKRHMSGLSSGEGLIWAVRDPIFKRHHIKHKGRIVDHQDVQEDPGVTDKRLMIIEPEFVRVLRAAGREGSVLSPLLREAWDSGNLNSLTKNNHAAATGAHISLMAHTTRVELCLSMSEVEITNGFANRFLWCAVRRSKLLPMGGDPVDLGHLDHQVALLIDHARLTGEVPFDRAARELWCEEIYPRLSAGGHGISANICNRAEAQVRRLALVYALLDGTTRQVRREHLLAALALWDYCEQSVRWIFGASSGDPVADEILGALQAAGERGMSQTEISELFKRHESKARLGQAMAALAQAGLARKVLVPTAGRAATRWFVVAKEAKEAKKAPNP